MFLRLKKPLFACAYAVLILVMAVLSAAAGYAATWVLGVVLVLAWNILSGITDALYRAGFHPRDWGDTHTAMAVWGWVAIGGAALGLAAFGFYLYNDKPRNSAGVSTEPKDGH